MKEGTKYDVNKIRYSLLPIKEIESVVEVLEYGANKYEVDNWQKVDKARQRYYDALMRHVTAWKKGELKDDESNLSHLAHAACNALFLLWFENNKEL
jgi:hypothetical protein